MTNLFIISAPSGAGKTTLCKAVLEHFKDMPYSISYTTREPRVGETDGIDYHFISKEDFINGIEKGKWAEWAEVHGNFYGTSCEFLDRALESGDSVLLDIDVQGTMQILRHYPEGITIFIMPPSLNVLKTRMEARGTDKPEVIAKRLINAEKEMAQRESYRHVMVNDVLPKAIEELISIIEKYSKKTMKTEILFGIHPIYEALRNKRRVFAEVCIVKEKTSKRLGHITEIAKSFKILVNHISLQQLKSMTGTDQHQGIGARVSPYPLADLSDMLPRSESAKNTCLESKENPPFLLLLDSVVDVHNLGALIRTALCAGVSGVIIPKDRAAPPTPAVSKASAGALEHVRLTQVTNMVNTIRELKENGIWIAGTDIEAKQSVFETDLTVPLAMVIGGEEKGIRPLVRKHCDFLVSIPQSGPLNSLNASVAGAVTMYEVFRQRRCAV